MYINLNYFNFIFMKKYILFYFIFFSPSYLLADWFQIFSVDKGDLFIDTESIKKNNNKVIFDQLVNYKKSQKNGMLSLKTITEINCQNLQTRDLNYEIYKKRMGLGKNFYTGKPKKKWKNSKQGTSAQFLNKVLCDRVIPK